MPLRQALGEIRLGRLTPTSAALVFFLLSLFISSCSLFKSSPPAPSGPGIYHVVKRGENLYRIGKAYDFSYRELARLNGIGDPNQISAGQRIFIPGASRQLPVEIITPVSISLKPRSTTHFPTLGNGSLAWPILGIVTSGFGARGDAVHDGIDIAAAEGTPVHVVESGEVIYSDQLRGYGNLVIVRHGGNLVSVYAHNRKNKVKEGDTVNQGDTIAEVGSTGNATAPHLHFEIRKENVAENPLNYLRAQRYEPEHSEHCCSALNQ
jgi:murein DD-endopeptidase MepM/ murein hydrolase activator NlpD